MSTTVPFASRPVIFFLPDEDRTTRVFDSVAHALDEVFDVVSLSESTPTGLANDGVEASVRSALRRIRRHAASRWLLVGHGTGGVIASLVAERTLAGEAGVFGLRGVVVLSDAPASSVPTAVALPEHLVKVAGSDAAPDAIERFWRERASLGPRVPDDVARTIASGRTSSRTRALLAQRSLADDRDYRPGTLSPSQLGTLRAIADRAVPQGDDPIDLAARLDADLPGSDGDGWRNATLPPDIEAYRSALDELADFTDLTSEAQDARLAQIVEGDFEPGIGSLSAQQLSLWFEDCRVDLVRLWLAHPATMARIGFDGFANGGDLVRIQGFLRIGAGERENWEPTMGGAR